MKSINVVVINPSFMTAFLGTGILCLVVAVRSLFFWSQPEAKLTLAASVVYLVGCFATTVIFNGPLNDRLAALGDPAEAVAFWPRYLAAWNKWNHVRSAAGMLSSGLYVWALYTSVG